MFFLEFLSTSENIFMKSVLCIVWLTKDDRRQFLMKLLFNVQSLKMSRSVQYYTVMFSLIYFCILLDFIIPIYY